MKKFNEMTDQELVDAMNQMKAEQEARTKAAEEKRKADEEKRKAEEEAKRKADEKKQREADAKKESELVEKQKEVLGKYYKKTIYDTDYLYPTVKYTHYYKVIGVYENLVMVSDVSVRGNYVSRSISYLNIDDLFAKPGEGNRYYYKPITREEFEAEYDKAMNSFTGLADMINNLHNWLF